MVRFPTYQPGMSPYEYLGAVLLVALAYGLIRFIVLPLTGTATDLTWGSLKRMGRWIRMKKYRLESVVLIIIGVLVLLYIHLIAGLIILLFGLGGITGIINLDKYTSYSKFSTHFEEKRGSQVVSPEGKMKEGLIAFSSSFFVPGWGQVYNGEGWLKGWIYIIGIIVGYYVFIFPAFLVWLYGAYQAYRRAKKMNAGEIPFAETTKISFWSYPVIAVLLLYILASMAAAFVAGMASGGPG